jgi:hypothetical protein
LNLRSHSDSRHLKIARSVPELTRNAGIQLNKRVSLRGQLHPLSSAYRILSPSGPTMAKPSGDYIPSGGFVFLEVAYDD